MRSTECKCTIVTTGPAWCKRGGGSDASQPHSERASLSPQDDFLTPEAFADIIYSHFLFDVPRLLDLCTLYQSSNYPLLSKMVANVFERQPRYHDDLRSTFRSVVQLLDRVQEECGREGGGGGAVRLEDVRR